MRNFISVLMLVAVLDSCGSNNTQNQIEKIDKKTNSLAPADSAGRMETSKQENASFSSTLKDDSAEKFDIEVFRISSDGTLVKGLLSVNGKKIGDTFENDSLKIMPGTYPGFLRYVSTKGFVQGVDGYLGDTGDFLLEIGNVKWSNGKRRSSLLFHGGDKPAQSQGCIMLGPVTRDAEGNRVLGPDHTLRKLRTEFYGTNDPLSSPNKTITITIK